MHSTFASSTLLLAAISLLQHTQASPTIRDFIARGAANGQQGGYTTINSKAAHGAKINFKQTHICETTPGVKAFSGFIHLPADLHEGYGGAQPHDSNYFFWYFQSRNDPENSPLSLYFGGGPGVSSLGGATYENGPCFINSDSNSTTHNEWSWNNHVNMLYIDQPVQVGFSYQDLVPSTIELLAYDVEPIEGSAADVETNSTFVKGILPTQDPTAAPNTTSNAARILWTATQIFLQDFPEYCTTDDRVSLWTNSYGGHWGPVTMSHFIDQNDKIDNGTAISTIKDPKKLNLDTLGITNGCIDGAIEAPFYPHMAYNNTYGLQTISEDVYTDSLNNFTKSGGCNDLSQYCRALAAESDPYNIGNNDTVNAACAAASLYCFEYVQGPYVDLSGRYAFDISRDKLAVFPPDYIIGYMNQEWVQKDLGVPLNFTESPLGIPDYYFGVTGDPVKVSIESINHVASSGVNVALVYGDRDYRCNWLGAEAISLAMEYPGTDDFAAAGYEALTTNSSYQGGLVRQHNSVSFSRVFQAGHSVGAFQPETVYRIFDRVMSGKDVATGEKDVYEEDYSSEGLSDSWSVKNELTEITGNECYVWDAAGTCTDEQMAAVADGSAVLKDYIFQGTQSGEVKRGGICKGCRED